MHECYSVHDFEGFLYRLAVSLAVFQKYGPAYFKLCSQASVIMNYVCHSYTFL